MPKERINETDEKSFDPEFGCEGKERLTRMGVRKMLKRRRNKTLRLEGYKCPNCKGWHVGGSRR